MKLSTIALAGALALSSTFAFAQAGGAGSGGAAAIPETSGPATNVQGGVVSGGSMNNGYGTDRMEHSTTGMGHGTRRMDSGNPNGDPSGPTSLSGTGSSQYGGSVPGATGKN